MGAAGLGTPAQIKRSMINRRVSMTGAMRYDEIFPYLTKGCLLNTDTIPSAWRLYMLEADADSFAKTFSDITI
jgi:hypothetical protein